GRYTLNGNPRKLAEFFGVDSPDLFGERRYNVAPTQVMPIVRAVGGGRELALARWVLIPSWASEPKIGARLINARVETAAQKPAFRDAMKQRRCVVPVPGFYEWQKVGNTRQPYLIYMASGEPLGLAGLWERWRDADGRDVDTYVILTMPA